MTNLKNVQNIFYAKVSQILWEKWDPIGVNDGNNDWDDEYESYVPHICRLAVEGNDAFRIAGSLTSAVEQNMGLRGDREHDYRIAELIVKAKIDILG